MVPEQTETILLDQNVQNSSYDRIEVINILDNTILSRIRIYLRLLMWDGLVNWEMAFRMVMPRFRV